MSGASVTFDGMTVESNTATEAQIRESIGAPAKEANDAADPSAANDAAAVAAPGKADDAADDDDSGVDPASEAGKVLAKRKTKYSERIGELTKNWRSTERERDAAKAEAARLKAELDAARSGRPADQPKTEQPKAPAYYTRPEPSEDEIGTKYATYKDFVKDLAEWTADERDAKRADAKHRAEEETRQREAGDRFRARIDSFNGQLEPARKKYADFDEVLAAGQDVIAPPHVIEYLLDSDVGRELQYRLLKDRATWTRIAALPPLKAIAALGKLEDTITARPSDAERGTSAAAPKTNAHPIPKPLGGSPVASDTDEVSDDLPVDEFIRRENAKEAKTRRR